MGTDTFNKTSNLILINKESLVGAPCISIMQPWAWAILNAGKDIENRDWITKFRGRILIHAGKKVDNDGIDFLSSLGIVYKEDATGSILGSVTISDCVNSSNSKWFFGKYGFVLKEPRTFVPITYRGQLGIFKITKEGLDI